MSRVATTPSALSQIPLYAARLRRLLIGAAVASATAGFGVSTLAAQPATGSLRFNFSSELESSGTLRVISPYIGESPYQVGECIWPEGRSEISVTDARERSCDLPGDRSFPIPDRGEVGVLWSASGGQQFGVENGTAGNEVRLVRRDSANASLLDVSPVLIRYADGSDTRPVITSGPDALWIFSPQTGATRTFRAQVVEVSTATGTILQRTAVPDITRPLIVASADGLWLAPGSESGYSATTVGIWLAPIGSAKAELVRATNGRILGLTPDGRSMDVYLQPNRIVDAIYRWQFSPA